VDDSVQREIAETGVNSVRPDSIKSGRWVHLLTVLISGIFAQRSFSADQSKAAPPNIVLIVADDLGYGDIGPYGSMSIRTPNLDRLALEGVRLSDFYAFPVCTPTRAALITGRYPQNFGFDWVIKSDEKLRGLPATGASLPALLKKRGYATALYGKWHLGYKPEFGPNAHGFDEFFGFLTPDLDYYAHTDENGDPGLFENTKPIASNGYLTDLITDRAMTFIKKTQRPFFLEVAYNAPHWPFQPPDKPEDKRTKDTYGLDTGTRADYVRMVERLDESIGKVLQAVDSAGATKNTLVIFLSDNGGDRLSDNSPLFHGKYTLWEGGNCEKPAQYPSGSSVLNSNQLSTKRPTTDYSDWSGRFGSRWGLRSTNDSSNSWPLPWPATSRRRLARTRDRKRRRRSCTCPS
jgi:arylsulfatase A-like enzyme